jgi:dihydrofolate reductase/thymidylate synthase
MLIEAIVCFEKSGGLSLNGNLPWLKDKIGDLEYVRIMTSTVPPMKKNIIIMGRKTFETLPNSFFNDSRIIYVLSKNLEGQGEKDVKFFNEPKKIYFDLLNNIENIHKVFIFGGSKVYKLFMETQWINTIYITKIQKDYTCDTFFDLQLLEKNYELYSASSVDSKERKFEIWNRKYHPEYNYLELLEKVIIQGEKRKTRNGITYSLFGESLEFDIEKFGFPLITTKKMFFKGIAKELLWFIKGDTNVNHLTSDGVHIWDGNTSRDYLDSIGLSHYSVGCAGPIYGYQWRHFNAKYDFENIIHTEKGVDQLLNCIQEIIKNPTSRRLVITGWNPVQLEEMCLPPCHVLYQFYVIEDKLCCQMYQRSADLFLGLPFNIASTALLTYIIASITNYNVGKIRICIGDAHIYEEHLNNVLEQITRKPYSFPSLTINNKREDKSIIEQLENITYEDIILENYCSNEALKSKMAV